MRPIVRTFLCVTALMATVGPRVLPAGMAQTVRPDAGLHRGPLSPDEELSNLTQSLQLTGDQQNRLRPVLVNRREQLLQIHNDRTLSREGKSAKMRALDDGANEKVMAVLTEGQRPKYQAMIEKRKAQLAEQHAGSRPR